MYILEALSGVSFNWLFDPTIVITIAATLGILLPPARLFHTLKSKAGSAPLPNPEFGWPRITAHRQTSSADHFGASGAGTLCFGIPSIEAMRLCPTWNWSFSGGSNSIGEVQMGGALLRLRRCCIVDRKFCLEGEFRPQHRRLPAV